MQKNDFHYSYKNIFDNHSSLVVSVSICCHKHFLLICVLTRVYPTLTAILILVEYLKALLRQALQEAMAIVSPSSSQNRFVLNAFIYMLYLHLL